MPINPVFPLHRVSRAQSALKEQFAGYGVSATHSFERIAQADEEIARRRTNVPRATGPVVKIRQAMQPDYLAAMLPGGSAEPLTRSLMSRSVWRLVSMASVGISRSTSDAMESRKLSRSSTS